MDEFNFFSFLTLFGGLGLFLFGMNILGEGLGKFSGSKLKSVLESLTSNRIKSVALGAAVTAIIQSSSATTVMAVGFVNSGIMRLSQAIGIIMGANVGTTATSWILSLTGIQGDNFFIRLLKPESFAPVFVCIGVVITSFIKNQQKKDIGSIFAGFGILMIGMEIMSSSVAPLAEIPEFRNVLLLFTNPVLGIITGMLITAVIQSSSASLGILQALSVTGCITFSNAFPIILGQNIGTCITAVLSAIGTNKNAKRTAVAHLSFNIIGTLIFAAAYYILNSFIHFSFSHMSMNAAEIAVVHTAFNLITTAILLPFTKQLEKLACFVIRDDKKEEKYKLLDERLLTNPSVATRQAKNISENMAMYCVESFEAFTKLLKRYDEKYVSIIEENETTVDTYEDKLGSYLVKLSHYNLSVDDGHITSNILHAIGDFERISDHVLSLARALKENEEKNLRFTDAAAHEIYVLTDAVNEIINLTVNSFINNDIESAKNIEPLEQLIDKLTVKMKRHHIKRLKNNECSIEIGFIFNDMITSLERIADHCSNIAVCLIQVSDDSFDTHEYLNSVKYDGENDFYEKYNNYKTKYSI